MKTDTIELKGRDQEREQALLEAEKFAKYMELNPKTSLQIRLLVEEAIGMLSAISGNYQADFWMEGKKEDSCQIHLKMMTEMSDKKRKDLIDASTSKKNDAYAGLTGKIREFFDRNLALYDVADYAALDSFSGFTLGMMTAPSFMGGSVEVDQLIWSLSAYKSGVAEQKESNDKAREAWDELEKSILGNIADDVRVSIKGNMAELTILKKMNA